MVISIVQLCSFWIEVLSSVISAIIVLFILFFIFRPRIKINKEIAIDEDGKLMFCFCNRSIAPCIDVQAAVKVVKEHDNADETEYKIELEDSTSSYMSGRWSKLKDSEIGVVTKNKKEELPPHLRIIVSAKHAISGIVSVATQDFYADNAKYGTFEKGLFIPQNSDYARIYSRAHLKTKKIVSWICAICVIMLALAYRFFFEANWQSTAICFILLSCFTTLMIVYWSIHVQSRIDAFSSRKISQNINLLMFAFRKEFPNFKKEVEDIVPTEEDDQPRRVRTRRQ